jgi:hypothetical protein
MNADEFRDRLPEWIDGEMIESEHLMMQNFLTDHPDLQPEVDAYRSMWQALGADDSEEPAPGFESRFWTRVAEGNGSQPVWRQIQEWLTRWRWSLSLAVATCVVVVSVSFWQSSRVTPDPRQQMASRPQVEPSVKPLQTAQPPPQKTFNGLDAQTVEMLALMDLLQDWELYSNNEVWEDMDVVTDVPLEDLRAGT